jgi:hypothetical protein
MPGPNIQGTFATGAVAASGNASDVMVVPTNVTSMKLSLTGLDASNTVKTQKRVTSSTAWVDQTTYNSNQSAVTVTVAANEEWRVLGITQQVLKDIKYTLSCES